MLLVQSLKTDLKKELIDFLKTLIAPQRGIPQKSPSDEACWEENKLSVVVFISPVPQ